MCLPQEGRGMPRRVPISCRRIHMCRRIAEAARSARRLARSGGVALALSRRPELPLVQTGAFARSLRAVAWGPEMPPDGGGFA